MQVDDKTLSPPLELSGCPEELRCIRPGLPHKELLKVPGVVPVNLPPCGLTRSREFFESMVGTWLLRERYCRDYGYSLLSAESLDVLARFCAGRKTLEVGCGSGYLSKELRMRGVDVTASDLGPKGSSAFGITAQHQLDHQGPSEEQLPGDWQVVVMGWPPLSHPFAMNVALRMKAGQWLVYLGEWGGACADSDFFDGFRNEQIWRHLSTVTRRLNLTHQNFYGIRERWSVWRKGPHR